MIFNFDKKEYDSEKLSDEGKIVLQKLQNIVLQKQQLTIQFTDLEVLQKYYSELLRKELPTEEKEEQKTGA
jgi:hypothetical protein